jgi:DNA-binding GntR family transcriptional regulator
MLKPGPLFRSFTGISIIGTVGLVSSPPKTRTEEAFRRLRSDILGGSLRPGQKLPFVELASTYNASVGVLREALSRLLEQGLVKSAPQQGFFVTPISRTDLEQLTEARCEIESLTLRHSIAEGGVYWESEVLAAHHRLASAPMYTDDRPIRLSEEWAEAHRVFHETLLLGCRNERLLSIATSLRASAELYRQWSAPLDQTRDIKGEHQGITDAVLARDPDLATQRLCQHISLTSELLLAAETDGMPSFAAQIP